MTGLTVGLGIMLVFARPDYGLPLMGWLAGGPIVWLVVGLWSASSSGSRSGSGRRPGGTRLPRSCSFSLRFLRPDLLNS